MIGPVRVWLNTPDKVTAVARLRKIVTREQQRMDGLLPRKELAAAGRRKIGDHLADYEADLKAQELKAKHIKDTTRRIARIIRENKWRALADMTGPAFTAWRADFKGSAKTKKEYQLSLNAFANWLVRQARLERNPLLGVSRVETRGKQVRVARPFTVDELQRLFDVSGPRTVVYQSLFYMGQRMIEVYLLRWCDLELDGKKPRALFRKSTTKDKADRWVPLPLLLAAKLRALWLPAFPRDRRVFWHLFPSPETFHADLKKAGIPRKGSGGEVVHFHSFRKTHASLGVDFGVAQKATQEVLGHSDANLTANIYARISSESLRHELEKLPWIDAHVSAHESGAAGHLLSFPGKPGCDDRFPKAAGAEELSHSLAPPVTPGQTCEMVDPTGVYPFIGRFILDRVWIARI
jgi:integrase